MLDAGPVVPAAIEQNPLARGGQLGHVALEIPLRLLALRRNAEGADTGDPGVEGLGDPLDNSAFAGGVSALEEADDLQPARPDPLLQLHELDLQANQFRLVELGVQLGPTLLDQVAGRGIEGVGVGDLPRFAPFRRGVGGLSFATFRCRGFRTAGGVLLRGGRRNGDRVRLRLVGRGGRLGGRRLRIRFCRSILAGRIAERGSLAAMTVVLCFRHVSLLGRAR